MGLKSVSWRTERLQVYSTIKPFTGRIHSVAALCPLTSMVHEFWHVLQSNAQTSSTWHCYISCSCSSSICFTCTIMIDIKIFNVMKISIIYAFVKAISMMVYVQRSCVKFIGTDSNNSNFSSLVKLMIGKERHWVYFYCIIKSNITSSTFFWVKYNQMTTAVTLFLQLYVSVYIFLC